MVDEKINARNIFGHDQKKMAIAAILLCWFMIAFIDLCGVSNPFIRRPLTSYKAKYINKNQNPIIFTFSNSKTDVYDITGDVRIQGSSAAIFIASAARPGELPATAKPLPRKQDARAMTQVTNFTMTTGLPDTIPPCNRTFDFPAILFSAGHIGNHFHRITNILIPLFTTSHRFHRRVLFLVTDIDAPHVAPLFFMHNETLKKLSEFDAYDVHSEDEILCFPRMIVGLKAHPQGLSMDPARSANFTMRNFTNFMRGAYSLNRSSVHSRLTAPRRPRMLIITRNTTRRLTNQFEVRDLARSLGFETIATDFVKSIASTAELVNSVDVMVGVHGAGLTNMIFLPENAVLVQIIPLGLNSYADYFYGKGQAEEMKLKYLEYSVTANESSLVGKYPPNSEVYTNSTQLCLKDPRFCRSVFLDRQHVTLDLPRFNKTLSHVLALLHH